MLKVLNTAPQEPCTSAVNIPQSTNSELIFDVTKPVPSTLVLDGFLRRGQLAQQLGCSTRKLDRMHALREGPPRVCVGRTILYNIESVRAWLRSQEEQPLPVKKRRDFPRKKQQ
jgi:hypothetical protein